MNDKERLEEIERQLNRAEIKRENLDIEDFQNILEHQLINGNLTWLVKYAKKQAERVQELEDVNSQLERQAPGIELELLNMELTDALKQNKRYREVIDQIKNNIPLEFNHISEYEAKKNVIRLINIDNLVDEYLEGESDE